MNVGISDRAIDQDLVPGIGDITELRDIVLAQQIVDCILPGSRLATAAWSLAPYRMPKALSVDAWRSPVARKPWVFWP